MHAYVFLSLVVLFFTNSIPIINPFPLISPTISYFYFIRLNSFNIISPYFLIYSYKFSSSIIFKTSLPAAQANGDPPNVLKCNFLASLEAISFEVATAAKFHPFPIPFAIVIISGTTP